MLLKLSINKIYARQCSLKVTQAKNRVTRLRFWKPSINQDIPWRCAVDPKHGSNWEEALVQFRNFKHSNAELRAYQIEYNKIPPLILSRHRYCKVWFYIMILHNVHNNVLLHVAIMEFFYWMFRKSNFYCIGYYDSFMWWHLFIIKRENHFYRELPYWTVAIQHVLLINIKFRDPEFIKSKTNIDILAARDKNALLWFIWLQRP